MRGQQLGAAIGARVTSTPSEADRRWADVVVLVKRFGVQWCRWAHKGNVPIVWDALDCWAQPGQNMLQEAEQVRLLEQQLAQVRPVLTLAATEAMAAACRGVYVPHHTWDGLVAAPVREQIRLVAYEGNKDYLGPWVKACHDACVRRGWTFDINPPDLRAVDLFVALRAGAWDGWACREWKSGVKLGNAMAAGRPIITQPSAAAREMAPVGSIIESVDELDAAFDRWSPRAAREEALDQPLARSLTLDQVAAQYQRLVQGVLERAA